MQPHSDELPTHLDGETCRWCEHPPTDFGGHRQTIRTLEGNIAGLQVAKHELEVKVQQYEAAFGGPGTVSERLAERERVAALDERVDALEFKLAGERLENQRLLDELFDARQRANIAETRLFETGYYGRDGR